MTTGDSVPQGDSGKAARQGLRRWLLVSGLALILSLAMVVMFMLVQATNNRQLYEQYYLALLAVNVGAAVLLLLVIGWIVVRLFMRLRRGKFGSRLLIKLAAIFAMVGLLPGAMIYVVSYQFVSRSIETWFDVKVEGALDAGLNLGRATIDALGSDLATKAAQASNQLVDVPDSSAGLALERIKDQTAATDVLLWRANGTLLASAGESRFSLNPSRPSAQMLRTARSQRVVTFVEGLEELRPESVDQARIRVLALVLPPAGFDLGAEPRYLQIVQALPPKLVANALAVEQANREYQERALARTGLRRMYIGTLTLSLVLAVFGAVLLAVVLGNQLVRPLLVLADGVRDVAAGDLSPKAALQSHDELGGLTRSFAQMTQQLADARHAVEVSMVQLDSSREKLQTILDNLTAGVILLDPEMNIVSSNPGATRILHVPLAAYERKPLAEVHGLDQFAGAVAAEFGELRHAPQDFAADHWQQSFNLTAGNTMMPGGEGITLIARGAYLPDGTRLLVFDDVSEMVSAQRAQAWGDVARRLAHEIKNPLTPIQLSAERLEHKLANKLAPPDQALLSKAVRTIVEQVDAMKRLVNEFRDYARLPSAELSPMDLNALVLDVLQLYDGAAGTGAEAVAVTSELDPHCPPVRADAQQIRQVLHNLVQNAQDSTLTSNSEKRRLAVRIRTEWNAETGRVRLSVLDSGAGFPDAILKRAFEPYVTTKAKGTGLGLAVVKRIADDHGARIDLGNRFDDGKVIGAQVSLSFTVGTASTS